MAGISIQCVNKDPVIVITDNTLFVDLQPVTVFKSKHVFTFRSVIHPKTAPAASCTC